MSEKVVALLLDFEDRRFLLQLVALLIRQMDGEVLIAKEEFEAFEGVDVKVKTLSNQHTLLYVSFGEGTCDCGNYDSSGFEVNGSELILSDS